MPMLDLKTKVADDKSDCENYGPFSVIPILAFTVRFFSESEWGSTLTVYHETECNRYSQ